MRHALPLTMRLALTLAILFGFMLNVGSAMPPMQVQDQAQLSLVPPIHSSRHSSSSSAPITPSSSSVDAANAVNAIHTSHPRGWRTLLRSARNWGPFATYRHGNTPSVRSSFSSSDNSIQRTPGSHLGRRGRGRYVRRGRAHP
ncbi:uncharacterized protein FOMMEDRAFT_141148 [Fomitiporia mediterranea MF3/22]|uniref:uncharacterized protein n=1 Tax=Fomitiporia mediterranea (strain MF3/22) TaxID=694068 RepID=UPI00044077A6|nr:uncharacterized protein FOMMEDRAFT_141148 [Fomitiporia mediterranea MF3/22]EJD01926.1 hypothetical protein FOMMEDRAFT_141148 [Fomitiporia mediterranea MF3/22]